MLSNSKLFEKMILNNWIAVVYANMDGIIEFVNPAANELYGYEGTVLIGQHVSVFNSYIVHNRGEIMEALLNTLRISKYPMIEMPEAL